MSEHRLVADDEATEDLAMVFRLQRTHDGYFLEDHVKQRSVDPRVLCRRHGSRPEEYP